VSRARKPGDKFFLLETLICEIYVPILGAAREARASERASERARIYSPLDAGNLGTLFDESFPIHHPCIKLGSSAIVP